MAGIDPHGPHEIEAERLTKQMKKAAAEGPPASLSGAAPRSGREGLPRDSTARQRTPVPSPRACALRGPIHFCQSEIQLGVRLGRPPLRGWD